MWLHIGAHTQEAVEARTYTKIFTYQPYYTSVKITGFIFDK